jgi:2-dehydro-3-deoxygalactonokinase
VAGHEDIDKDFCAIYVDMGTTNTRVWMMRGDEILARASRAAGVRNSAHDGSTTRIQAVLKELIAEVQNQTKDVTDSNSLVCIAAAGMITSPLGLAELPHLPAPAGRRELSHATRSFEFPEISPLPFLLVPGVRTGSTDLPSPQSPQAVGQSDVMRGEETLCAGLHALGLVARPGVVLTLGSHWKAIRLDVEGRVDSSITTLSGELIHAVQTQTILASAVGNAWPAMRETDRPASDRAARDWIAAGMQEQRQSSLARALFCVRLLELGDQGTPQDRFSFLLGAFIASDLDALLAGGALAVDSQVTISGHGVIAKAWAHALAQMAINSRVLTEEETERAFLCGLKAILSVRGIIKGTVSIGQS